MQFQWQQTREDFGGTLTVTAETPAEVKELSDHFKLHDTGKPEDLMNLATALQAGRLVHTSSPQKRPWFEVESALDHEFTKPYKDLLERLTGYADNLPDLDLTTFHPRRLCHTHITATCGLEHEHYVYRIIKQSEAWNDKTAQEYADSSAQDYAEEELGFRPHEREYVQAKNGGYQLNPNYLKRHRAKPGTGAPWLWSVLFRWWLDNHATEAQRAAIAENDATHAKHKLSDSDWMIRHSGTDTAHLVGSSGLYLTYDEPVRFMKWEEFKTLGK
jgi:hypothetical protein